MKNIFFLTIGLIFLMLATQAQSLIDISNTSKCEDAIDITRFPTFGPTTAPEKLGTTSKSSFELVKHPTWYKFTIQEDGILLFDIIPQNPKDNYDFMLFKANSNFCVNYNSSTTPIRSNFSPQKNKKGITGLSFNGNSDDFDKGIMSSKGEVYYLVLNNVYPKGKGHTIVFKQLKTNKISGKITNKESGKSLKANISWQNLRNKNILVSSQTEKKGSYEIDILLSRQSNSFPKYELCAYSKNFFPEFKIFSTSEANNLDKKEINFELEKIKKGLNNETFGVIYFQPNETTIVPSSDKVKRKLFKLMELNKQVKIILEGHTNGLVPSTEVDFELSRNRAKVIKQYLTDNGIAPERIATEGMGSKNEVYPIPETEEEEGFNRRVEVNIVSF